MTEDSSGSVLPWVVGTPIVLFVLYSLSAPQSPESQAKSQARSAISLCWDEQKRKSATPAEQRFIAGACERMERDFREQFKVNP